MVDLMNAKGIQEEGYRFVVYVSDKHLAYLYGFLQLWDKYARYPILVIGFTCPPYLNNSYMPMGSDWRMPVGFFSIGDFADYPADKWTDSMIVALENAPIAETFVFLLEDYFLVRPVNKELIKLGFNIMSSHQNVLRFDLTTDRLNARGSTDQFTAKDVFYVDGADIIETVSPSQYQMSTQAGIWRKNLLREFMIPGEDPWTFEMSGTRRVNDSPYRVFGTRQFPMRYTIAVNKGRLDLSGGWQFPPTAVTGDDQAMLKIGKQFEQVR